MCVRGDLLGGSFGQIKSKVHIMFFKKAVNCELAVPVPNLLFMLAKCDLAISQSRIHISVKRSSQQGIPGCIPCKVYAEDTPILTIDSIVICQTHAEDLRRRLLKMHPGRYSINVYQILQIYMLYVN